MAKQFQLNQEELDTLKVIRDLNDKGSKADYYEVVEGVHGDTGTMVPVVARLDDDGYIKSSGIIHRYCHITDKGRRALSDKGL